MLTSSPPLLTTPPYTRIPQSSKQAKKAHHEKLQSLLASPPEVQTVTPSSSGYISDMESGEEGEEGIVMVEDYAALEEEGVTGLKKGKYTLRKVCSGDSKGLLGGGHNMAAPVVLLLH